MKVTVNRIGHRLRRAVYADVDTSSPAFSQQVLADSVAGAANLAEVEANIDASFAGQFEVLRYDASYVTEHDGHAIGAILVAE